MFNLYADVDARSMTPSRNTRSYTLRSVPSSPGRSFLHQPELKRLSSRLEEAYKCYTGTWYLVLGWDILRVGVFSGQKNQVDKRYLKSKEWLFTNDVLTGFIWQPWLSEPLLGCYSYWIELLQWISTMWAQAQQSQPVQGRPPKKGAKVCWINNGSNCHLIKMTRCTTR